MPSLDGKVAIITGAARGQGEAEARLFAAEGAKVVITDVLDDRGAAAAAEIGDAARFMCHDVSQEADWMRVVDTTLAMFGRIDILINNAAISGSTKLEDTTPDDYDRVYRVNQFGVYLGMRAVLEPMKSAGGGCIINISSVAGTKGTSTLFPYAASKWAVRGMTKAAALELARYRIRVNAIVPGVIETEILRDTPQRMAEAMLQTTPMRRRGLVEEIAGAALYLTSPAAGFVTGIDLTVDGGMSL
jgi:3alpha(or 20beta)-hydroxysteroid dehydrogenase